MFENSSIFEAFNHNAQLWAEALDVGSGLFVITGGTQSGKSTFWALTARYLEAKGYDVRITDGPWNHSSFKSDLVDRRLREMAVKPSLARPHGRVAFFPFDVRDECDVTSAVERARDHIVVTTTHGGSLAGGLRIFSQHVRPERLAEVLRGVSLHTLKAHTQRSGIGEFDSRYPISVDCYPNDPEEVVALLNRNKCSP